MRVWCRVNFVPLAPGENVREPGALAARRDESVDRSSRCASHQLKRASKSGTEDELFFFFLRLRP